MNKQTRTFGVLALQGDFAAHAAAFRDLDVSVREVRRVAELDGVAGLVIPGGESTTLLNLMADESWFEALRRFHEEGGVLAGTCAGAILLAREVRPRQPSLAPLAAVFIRAPRFRALWPGVEVLARLDGEPVLVQQGRVVAATFHPELTRDRALHRYLVGMAEKGPRAVAGPLRASA